MHDGLNKIQVVNKNYKLKELYDELVEYVNSNIHDNVEFKSTYDDSIPEVLKGDCNILKKILGNLLRNSINCTSQGYISFTFNSIVKDDICKLVIVVEDSGFGIKDEDIDKLFNKTDHGFGLTSTREVLELMGGTIAVQSKYNEGSRFTLSIEQKVSHDILFDGKNKKILIVDDDPEILNNTTDALKELNLDVTSLNNGIDCINKILDGNKYELILLDDAMEELDGIATLSNLNKIIGFNTPVIIFTPNVSMDKLENYINTGFTDYLVKPTDNKTLVDLGALYTPLVKNGEYYRLITCSFLHIGIIHLLCNMYVIFIIGPQLESFYGKTKFIIIYLFSALMGSLFSCLFTNGISAGASGAIFGLFGSLLYFGHHYRAYLGNVIASQVIPLLLFNFALGFMLEGIDVSAHIGGLIGGYLISMAVGVKYKSSQSEKINGIIITTIFTIFMLYLNFK